MAKPKAPPPPRDYNADLRFKPYPREDSTSKELAARGHAFVKAVLNGAGVKRKPVPKKP